MRLVWVGFVVIAVIGAVSCGDDANTSTTTTSVSKSTISPTTSVVTTTTEQPSTTSTTTSTAPPTPPDDALLVSGPDGIGTWTEADGIDWWYTDQPVAIAHPDGEGGVIFQPYPDGGVGSGCTPILRLAEAETEPDLLIDTVNDECVTLDAVGSIDGSPQFIYSYWLPAEQGDEESYARQLVLHDVDTAVGNRFEVEGTFDGGLLSASISNQRLALTFQGSSDQGVARFYDRNGNATEPPFPPPSDPIGVGDCWKGDLSPDGSLYAYAHTRNLYGNCGGIEQPTVWIIDLDTGEQLATTGLTDAVEWPGAESVSFASTGDRALIVTMDAPPLTIDTDGTVTSLNTLPREVWTLRTTDEPAECLSFAFANSDIWCAPEYHLTFW